MNSYRGRHRNTRNRLRQALREACDLAGEGATTEALTPALVARFAARGGRKSTTAGLLASLRVAVKFAAGRRYVRGDLVGLCSFRAPGHESARRRHHGRAEVARVLARLAASASDFRGGRLHAFACVLAYCGLRKTEALRLKVADVDLRRGFLFVKPNGQELKTPGSEAPVPIPAALAKVLAAWVPRCGSEWLISRMDRRGPWVGGSYGDRPGDRLKAEGLASGVDGFTPVSLRHSLASHLAGWWGCGREQIRLMLRHTTEQTQGYYVHPDLANLRQAVHGFDYGSPRRPPANSPRRPSVRFPRRPPYRGPSAN